jgi:outer membrane protein assembly factor BamB
MSSISRWAILVLSMLGTLTGVSLVGTVYAQKMRARPPVGPGVGLPPGAPGAPGAPPKKPSYDLGSLTLPKDDDLAQTIESTVDKIKTKDWAGACENIQKRLMGRPEDIWAPVTRKAADGTETTAYVSVKKEGGRMLANLPKEGMQFYKDTYGPKAKDMVKQARENSNPGQMGQAMGLYLYTDEGAEAAVWMGTHMLDRAEYQGAARVFMQLLNRGDIKDLKERTLIKAAYAFHRAGETIGKELVFKELTRRGSDIKLRDQALTVAEVRDAIDKMVSGASLLGASDSPYYRGRPSRTAMLPGGTPYLEAVWRQKMWHTDEGHERVKAAQDAINAKAMPLLTSFVPITATTNDGNKQTPLLIYRSYSGIHAIDMRTGKHTCEQPADLSIDEILGAKGTKRDAHKVDAYTRWLGFYLQQNGRPQILFENSILNTLSTDNKFVYGVEDLAVPPPASFQMNAAIPGGGGQSWGPEITSAINHNRLFAYDLSKDLKVAWDIGGTEKGELSDSYFLSAPLPLNGRLYVLTEKQQDLRLVTLEPATGKILGIQALAQVKDTKLSQEPVRRTQACHLSYAEGILIVPTNAGAIFGVDLFSNSLLWAYPYRSPDALAKPVIPQNNPWMVPPGWMRMPDGTLVKINPEVYWEVTAPAIADGKVVFTAPDEKDIHCVNVRDGSRIWSATRDNDDLYMAGVFNGKVVIVGKNRTRALSLAKGEELWRLETGKPSGQGAASMPPGGGDVLYYLPIRESASSREPEVCAINVDKGMIQAHTRSRKREIPGNLIFYEGTVLSQTHLEVVAYPQLEVKLAEMDRLVKANPNDPTALADRGDYLLDKGDLTNAIADFRKALRNKPGVDTLRKARAKLHESYTELLQRDFAKGEDYIGEYEELCNIDLNGLLGAERTAAMAEMRKRRANFLCLVGKGREGQNRLVEAFDKYLELGMEAKDDLIQVVDEPTVKTAPDVWSQGRIASMVVNAKDPKQRAALEEQIKKRWDKVKDSKVAPLDDLRKFVALFGSLFDVGKEARLALAERLMDDNDVNSLLEAEQQLSLLRNESEKPEITARALEALARLNQGKKLLEDAAFYYRQLAERFPTIKVNGKTGAEYLDDLATDKRYLPYIDQTGRFTIKKGTVNTRSEIDDKKYFAPTSQIYQFSHVGEKLPFFDNHKVGLTLDPNHQLKITDVTTNEVQTLPLTRTMFNQIATGNGNVTAAARVKFSYQNLGHLVVLQLGNMIFGIDPLNKPRVLWEKNVSMLPNAAANPPSMTFDAKENTLQLLYSDGLVQRLGTAGPLQGGVVTVAFKDSLMAIDPITGRTLWTRTDINSRSHIFGDKENVYVVNLSDDGKPSGTRVLRAYDGVTVKAKDFTALYNARAGIQGRSILTSQNDATAGLTLRLYDIVKGDDAWKQTFPVGSVQMTSEDPNLTGIVEPTGVVRVFDIEKRKEVMTSKLYDVAHLGTPQAVYLLADQDHVYVAMNGPQDPNVINLGGMTPGVMPNVLPTSGLRSVPVNGYVTAFKRKTGAFDWYAKVENQQMIVSMLDELPVLLFTARYYHRSPPPANFQQMKFTMRAYAKHTGKLWYGKEDLPQNMFFHTLTMDHRAGKVEFIGVNMKVTLDTVAR